MRVNTDHSLGHCTSRRAFRSLAAAGTRAYAYHFEHPGQDNNSGIPCMGQGNVAVSHASDIPFVFACGMTSNSSVWPHDPLHANGSVCPAGAEPSLSSTISRYWSRFAESGSPNGPGLPEWAPYKVSDDAVQVIDSGPGGIRPESGIRRAACDWWDAHDNFRSWGERLPRGW